MNNYYSNYYNRDTLSDGAVAAVVVCVLLGIAALLVFQILTARCMKRIAVSKGHPGKKTFWLCFFFGVFGWVYAAALPDLILRQGKENGVGASGAAASRPSDGQPHVCSRCGAVLADNADFCAACGTPRR